MLYMIHVFSFDLAKLSEILNNLMNSQKLIYVFGGGAGETSLNLLYKIHNLFFSFILNNYCLNSYGGNKPDKISRKTLQLDFT